MENGLRELVSEVLNTAKRAYKEQLIAGTSGNVSALYKEKNWMVITPSGYDYSIMEEKDIVITDLEGNIIEGIHKPSSEWRMHAEVYKNVSYVGAIVHTHSPYASSFAVLRKEIPVILVEMLILFKGSLKVSPYAKQGSKEVGTNAVPFLKEQTACLMANHGVLAVGENVAQAYTNSVYVEDIAKIYHMALEVGEPTTITE
ncbi:MAG: class II aldolase/adducin family protein [Hespellia sp.]|nr:class II aldolase/adducin family protein [Hespellia sp.]